MYVIYQIKKLKKLHLQEITNNVHLLTITSSACRTRSAVFASNSAFKRLKAENSIGIY